MQKGNYTYVLTTNRRRGGFAMNTGPSKGHYTTNCEKSKKKGLMGKATRKTEAKVVVPVQSEAQGRNYSEPKIGSYGRVYNIFL